MDPLPSGIGSFQPHQLHELLKRVILDERSCNFAALKQLSIYVLQFWGVARFLEIQSLKIGHLVRRVDRFDLFLPCLKECSLSDRVVPIYPTPLRFEKTFCPVFILTTYLRARYELGSATDDNFLFP